MLAKPEVVHPGSRSMLLTPAAVHPCWPGQTAVVGMNTNSHCQLAQHVSPLGSVEQHADACAQNQNLQLDSFASIHPATQEHTASSSQKPGLSNQNGPECLSLKEKNRRAQRKFREKQKVSF